MQYTVESLQAINPGYMEMLDAVEQADVDIANYYVELIEKSRSKKLPKAGDLLQYLDNLGEYHGRAHIEFVDEKRYGGNVCEGGSCAFVYEDTNKEIGCNGSGGPWCSVAPEKMEYVGEDEKMFWTWGSHGAGAHRGIYFKAKVSVWKYTHPDFKGKFTTKDYDKFYINSVRDEHSQYKYQATAAGEFTSKNLFKTKKDLESWIRTYRGEYDGNECWGGKVLWTWKEITHTVSPDVFDNLDLPEDTFLINARIMRCKMTYDEEKHEVHKYYVWYWDGYYENATLQNKIREERYELPYTTPEFILARKELEL